jgi:hypothetical protein
VLASLGTGPATELGTASFLKGCPQDCSLGAVSGRPEVSVDRATTRAVARRLMARRHADRQMAAASAGCAGDKVLRSKDIGAHRHSAWHLQPPLQHVIHVERDLTHRTGGLRSTVVGRGLRGRRCV